LVKKMIYPLDSDLKPVIFKEQFQALLKDKEWQKDEIVRCSEERWYFIVNYCWTIRKDDTGSYVERVPPKEYLRLVADDWCRRPFYLLSKSRQLMATWLFIILHLHACMFKENILVCCQTKKEDVADAEMIQRARYVWQQLPVWMRKFSTSRYKYCKLDFPHTSSRMKGIPAGADQIRAMVPNYLLSDEFAFQPDAEEAYAAALPCCQRITLVSSANPGFMDELVHDRIKVA